LPYEKPEWSDIPKKKYSLEVIKNGVIIETLNVPKNEEFIVLGRLPLCDVQMDHPSISRYHAVIQFSDKGMPYIYDLGNLIIIMFFLNYCTNLYSCNNPFSHFQAVLMEHI